MYNLTSIYYHPLVQEITFKTRARLDSHPNVSFNKFAFHCLITNVAALMCEFLHACMLDCYQDELPMLASLQLFHKNEI